MAVISVTSELNVIEKYRELVEESLGGDSVYIRTKETLQELFDKGTLKDDEKSAVITTVLSNLNTSIVTTSMQTALEWAAREKDLALKKLELAKSLDILDQELELKTAQADKMAVDGLNAQAEALRMFGQATVVDGKVVSLADEGKVWEDMQLVIQNTENAKATEKVIKAQEQENLATAHKIVADTYVNYGKYTYTIGTSGITSINDGTGTYKTLSYYQAAIAKEQAKGYAYNAWANAATGVASTVGVAITSELPIFDPGEIGETLVNNLIDSTNNLKNITAPVL